MPRKKKIGPGGSEWVEEAAREEIVDAEDQEMMEIAQSLPGGVRCINLYRQPGAQGGRPKFIAQLVPESFSEATIQEMYGGGSYFARWQKKDGGLMRFQFDIEGPPRIQQTLEPEEDESPIYAEPIRPSGDERRNEMSTLDVIRMMSETRREAREEFRSLLELMRPAPAPPDATKQVFELVEKIVPMIGQGGGDGNPWITALTYMKEPLTKLVETINVAVTRPSVPAMPVQPSRMNPAAMQPHYDKPEVTTVQEPDMLSFFLKQYLPILVKAAAKNVDPGSYADLILDQVPESQYPKLKEWIEKPGCLDDLAKLDPGIRYQQEWWVGLRTNLIEALNVPSGVQPESDNHELDEVS